MQAHLIDGPVRQRLTELAVPMVWALLAMMSLNAADTFFVAQLGDQQLAAMSFGFPVEMVFMSIAIGAGAGMSSSLSRLIGAGDSEQAKRLVTDGLVLFFTSSIVLALLGYSILDAVFERLGAEAELMPYIYEYMNVWFWGVPIMITMQACMATLRALGLSRLQGRLMTAMSLANIALDPLLIFGLLGFPRMELAGAALATVIVRSLALVVALYVVGIKLKMFSSPVASWAAIRLSWQRILHVGLPAIGTNMIIPLANGIIVAMVAQYGSQAVAGLGVASRIEPLALIVFYALSSIVGPFFGQNFGAKRFERLDEALSLLVRFCITWGLMMALVLFLFGETIAGWFSDTEEVISVASFYLLIVPISYGAYGIVMSVNAAFNGLGMPMPGLVISTCRVLIVYLPLALLGRYLWGINGLFIATSLANLILGVWGYWWLRRRIRSLSPAALQET